MTAIEGTRAGVERMIARGVPGQRIIRHDLRRPLDLERSFDVAICTEVAEHIECPFAGQLVEFLTRHAGIVWFSFESPGTNEAHYHHSNEQPPKFWVNLFRFHGFRAIELPASIIQNLEARGRFIFASSELDLTAIAGVVSVVSESASLGLKPDYSLPPRERWRLLKRLMPPILLDAMSALRRR